MGANPSKELCEAAEKGDVKTVQSLLKSKADVNYAEDGWSALHKASNKGHEAVVELLLNSNANIDQQDNYRFTPLHVASMYGQVAVVEVLLARNADLAIMDKHGRTARHLAVLMGHDTVLKLLDKEKDTMVDGKMLAMLKELELNEPEARARGFAKDKLLLERLQSLPYDLIEKECLAHGMTREGAIQLASALSGHQDKDGPKSQPKMEPPATTTVMSIPNPQMWESISNNISQQLVTGNWRELRGATESLLDHIEADLLRQSEQGLIYITEQPLFFELAVFCNLGLRVLSNTPQPKWSKEQRNEFNALCGISRHYAWLLSYLGEISYGPTYLAESRWVVVYLLAQSDRFKDVEDSWGVKWAEAKALRVISSTLSPSLWAIYHQFLPKDVDQPKTKPPNKRISFVKKPLKIYSTTTRREITGDEDWITAKWILRIWQLEDKYVPVPQGVDLSSTLSKGDHKWLGQLGWSFQKPAPIVKAQRNRGAFFKKVDEKKFNDIVAQKKSNSLSKNQTNEVKQWLHALFPRKAETLFAQGFDTWNSIFHLMESDVEDLTSRSPPSPPAAPPKPPPPPSQPVDEQSSQQPGGEQQRDQSQEQQRGCFCRIISPDNGDDASAWTDEGLRQVAQDLRNGNKILNIINSRVSTVHKYCLHATQEAAQNVSELEQFLRHRLGRELAENPADCKYLALANILRSETVILHMSSTMLCDDSRDQFLTAYLKHPNNVVPVFLEMDQLDIPFEHLLYHLDKVTALKTSRRKIQSRGDFGSVTRQLIQELQLEHLPDIMVVPWLREIDPRFARYADSFIEKGFDTLEGFRSLQQTDDHRFPEIPFGHFRQIVDDVHNDPNEHSHWRVSVNVKRGRT